MTRFEDAKLDNTKAWNTNGPFSLKVMANTSGELTGDAKVYIDENIESYTAEPFRQAAGGGTPAYWDLSWRGMEDKDDSPSSSLSIYQDGALLLSIPGPSMIATSQTIRTYDISGVTYKDFRYKISWDVEGAGAFLYTSPDLNGFQEASTLAVVPPSVVVGGYIITAFKLFEKAVDIYGADSFRGELTLTHTINFPGASSLSVQMKSGQLIPSIANPRATSIANYYAQMNQPEILL